MHIHTIERVPFEGPAAIAGFLYSKGCGLTRSRNFAGARLPDLSKVDLLVVMGGPMSVHDVEDHPGWPKKWTASAKPWTGA